MVITMIEVIRIPDEDHQAATKNRNNIELQSHC